MRNLQIMFRKKSQCLISTKRSEILGWRGGMVGKACAVLSVRLSVQIPRPHGKGWQGSAHL